MSKLKDCPFCGNAAVTFEPDGERNIVSCKLGHAKFRTIEGWNTRVSDNRVKELESQIEAFIYCINDAYVFSKDANEFGERVEELMTNEFVKGILQGKALESLESK